MTGRCLQIFMLTKYPGRKWYKWTLMYPRWDPGVSADLEDWIKTKKDLFDIMAVFVPPQVEDWNFTRFKCVHPCGRSCLRVLWRGRVRRDGYAEAKLDRLGESPFNLSDRHEGNQYPLMDRRGKPSNNRRKPIT